MIHRIDSAHLRTGDALNKREERERHRPRREPVGPSRRDGVTVANAPATLEDERDRVTFDLVA